MVDCSKNILQTAIRISATSCCVTTDISTQSVCAGG